MKDKNKLHLRFEELQPLLFTSMDIVPTIDESGRFKVTIVDTNRYPEGLNHHYINSNGKLSQIIEELMMTLDGENVLIAGKRYKINQKFYRLNMELLKSWIEYAGKKAKITAGFSGINTDERGHIPPSFQGIPIDVIFNHYDIHPLADVERGATRATISDIRKLKGLWRRVENEELYWIHSPFGSWVFSSKSEYYEEIRRVAEEKGVNFVEVPQYFVAETPPELEEYAKQILREDGKCVIKSDVGFGGSARIVSKEEELDRYTKAVSPLNRMLVERLVKRKLVEIKRRREIGTQRGNYSIDLVQLVVGGEAVSCVIKVSPSSVEEDFSNYLPARTGMTFVFPQVDGYVHNAHLEAIEDSEAKSALRKYELERWLEMSKIAGIIGYEAMNRVVNRKEKGWEEEIEKAIEKTGTISKSNIRCF
jgi:hypothetical protein